MLLISFIPMYWYSKVYFRYAGKSLSTLPKEVLVDLFKYLTPHSYCNQMSNVTMGARKVAQKDFLNLASTCKLVQSVALEMKDKEDFPGLILQNSPGIPPKLLTKVKKLQSFGLFLTKHRDAVKVFIHLDASGHQRPAVKRAIADWPELTKCTSLTFDFQLQSLYGNLKDYEDILRSIISRTPNVTTLNLTMSHILLHALPDSFFEFLQQGWGSTVKSLNLWIPVFYGSYVECIKVDIGDVAGRLKRLYSSFRGLTELRLHKADVCSRNALSSNMICGVGNGWSDRLKVLHVEIPTPSTYEYQNTPNPLSEFDTGHRSFSRPEDHTCLLYTSPSPRDA